LKIQKKLIGLFPFLFSENKENT